MVGVESVHGQFQLLVKRKDAGLWAVVGISSKIVDDLVVPVLCWPMSRHLCKLHLLARTWSGHHTVRLKLNVI